MRRVYIVAALVLGCLLPSAVFAGGSVCPRYAAGSEVAPPPDLYSEDGVLHAALNYWTTVDEAGRTLFCYQTAEGAESPTFHVQPGDTLQIDLTNMLPPVSGRSGIAANSANACGGNTMTASSA